MWQFQYPCLLIVEFSQFSWLGFLLIVGCIFLLVFMSAIFYSHGVFCEFYLVGSWKLLYFYK
jgi:hypothetical protein